MKEKIEKDCVKQKGNLVIQDSNQEILIYDLDRNKAFCLNDSSAAVWKLCDGTKTVAEITDDFGKQTASPIDKNFIWFALEQLDKEGLLNNLPPPPTELTGMSRRQIIQKIGFGTIVALPIISALVVPLPIHAASGNNRAAGVPCTRSSQCRSTNTTTVTPTTTNNPAQTYTGSCCRNAVGAQPYGPGSTCVPGPTGGFTVVQGFISYNGNTTNGGPVSCLAG